MSEPSKEAMDRVRSLKAAGNALAMAEAEYRKATKVRAENCGTVGAKSIDQYRVEHIALALDQVRAEERERAAGIAMSHHGSGGTLKDVTCEMIATAIRSRKP